MMLPKNIQVFIDNVDKHQKSIIEANINKTRQNAKILSGWIQNSMSESKKKMLPHGQ